MDFITAPLTCGIVFYFIYKIFELVARRRERLLMIERMASNANCVDFKMPDMEIKANFGRFTALRIGLILLGLGLGLIVGILIALNIHSSGDLNFSTHELAGLIQGASIMLFGGLGMLASFLIEHKMSKKQ